MPNMAVSLRSSWNPFLSSSRIPQSPYSQPLHLASCPSKFHHRTFAHTPGHMATMGATQLLRPKTPPQMSMRNVVKDTMTGAQRDMIPDDLGLMPGTFIRPVWKNMPSIFRDPKRRLQMEWVSLKVRTQNFVRFVFVHSPNSS